MRRIKDCTSSLINHFKKVINSSKTDLPGEQSIIIPKISITDEKSESNESIDSGFVESIPGSCSEHSSLSSKSILRNSSRQPDQTIANYTPSGDKKSSVCETRKKVSIIAPSSPQIVSDRKHSRKRRKMKQHKIVKTSSSDEWSDLESVGDSCGVMDISHQIRGIIDAARRYLVELHPTLSDSVEILFMNNNNNYLASLSSPQVKSILIVNLYSYQLVL